MSSSHQALLARILPKYLEHIEWPESRIKAERTRRLRELLAIASNHSPWHRRRLADVEIGAVDESGVAKLPVMTKTDLMSNFDAIVTDRRLSRRLAERHLEEADPDSYLLDEYKVVASGGSSGQLGIFLYDREAWATCWASIVRFQIRDWEADPALAGITRTTAVVAAGKPSHLSAALGRTFSTPSSPRLSIPVTEPLERIVEWLNEKQPAVLMGYSSFLPRLAKEARSGRLRIAPRRVIAISEPLLPEARAAVENAWGVPIASGYGMSEGVFTGFCGRGIHLPDDLCMIEAVDSADRPVPVGTPSHRILITNLYNAVLPLIRFEVTDEVTYLDQACECGSQFRLIADPQGRLDDTFTYPGGISVHPHAFRSALGGQPGIVEYQVLQTERGADLQVVSEGAVDLTKARGAVGAALQRLGIRDPEVTILEVTTIGRQASGKLKRFVPLPAPIPPGLI